MKEDILCFVGHPVGKKQMNINCVWMANLWFCRGILKNQFFWRKKIWFLKKKKILNF